MLKTDGLTKLYRTEEIETTALENINIGIQEGEFVAVMGPSGCGKSTFLNLLGMLDNPSEGKYMFLGQDVSNAGERDRMNLRKRNIGFVFQSFNLIDELTVYENVELPLIYLKTPSHRRKNQVEDILQRMNILARRNHYPQQLSGGQQQRVAVARAAITSPKLLLADEPTGNLDTVHGQEVMNILNDLNGSGTTIIMVTHSSEYANYARRIIHLLDGHVVTEKITGTQHV